MVLACWGFCNRTASLKDRNLAAQTCSCIAVDETHGFVDMRRDLPCLEQSHSSRTIRMEESTDQRVCLTLIQGRPINSISDGMQ
jgi:hypothetical protein